MGKILGVELSNGKGQYLELDLPATDYELLDAFDRLHMDPSEKPGLEIINYTDLKHLYVHLDGTCSLCELNELSRRLDSIPSMRRTTNRCGFRWISLPRKKNSTLP